MQVFLQVSQWQANIDRRRVTHHMDVGVLEVQHPESIGPLEVGAADVPFIGDGPVQDGRSGRHLDDVEVG